MSEESRKQKFKDLPKPKKIQLIIATVLSASVMVALPVFAWFSNGRQAATVAKINSPAKLAIKAGKAEDIIQFKLSGINVGDGKTSGSQNFVFCVEGEDISSYNLQLAHTTNIDFTYTLYKAHTDANGDVIYTDSESHIQKYAKAFEFTTAYGDYINLAIDEASGRKVGVDNYTIKSYEDGEDYQKFAQPLYWQTKNPIDANAVDDLGTADEDDDVPYNEYNSVYGVDVSEKFLNFYVLEVSWDAYKVSNDKETDILYITAQVG